MLMKVLSIVEEKKGKKVLTMDLNYSKMTSFILKTDQYTAGSKSDAKRKVILQPNTNVTLPFVRTSSFVTMWIKL